MHIGMSTACMIAVPLQDSWYSLANANSMFAKNNRKHSIIRVLTFKYVNKRSNLTGAL